MEVDNIVEPEVDLNISGIVMQEESFESDDDEHVTKELEVVDTDTDGEELTIQEATASLKALAANQEQTAEFYSQLTATLTAMPIQYLDAEHPVTRNCVLLLQHVLMGISNPATRPWACVPFSLIIRSRSCVHELLRSPFSMPSLVRAVQEVEAENLRVVLLSSIRLLSASRACRQDLVRCGCLEMLLGVISEPSSGEMSKAHVVFALRRICKTTSSRELLANLYGVQPLLEFFFELKSQPVQKSLAGLLQTLATNPDVKVQMAELGAIPRFVQLLSISQLHMLKYVICIVRNVACNNDENRLLIARAGGIKVLLQLMPQVSVKLQQKIAGALQNLATNRDNRAQITQCGGVAVLIALIKTSDPKLQKYGLGGVKRLVYNSRESTLAFEKQGGLEPLVALLDSDDASVLKNAVHALNRVRHYIGREPIERLGGLAGMGRLLTCPHEKIRVLARRNLQSMDEDVTVWFRRIEVTAVRMLVAARVLLNTHTLVHPSTFDRVSELSRGHADVGRRRVSMSVLRKTLRSRETFRRIDSEPTRLTLSDSAAEISPSTPPQQEPERDRLTSSLDHMRGMTPEVGAVLDSLGLGETYWNLRPGTRHFLPIPLLEMILSMLDRDVLLSGAQRRAIFAWARDRDTIGRPCQEFLTHITNNVVHGHAQDVDDGKRSTSCIIS